MNAGLMSCARSRALKSSSAALAVGLALAAAGSLTSPACGQGQGADGRWAHPPRSGDLPPGRWPLEAEHAIHLPSGLILVWRSSSDVQLWDPMDMNGVMIPAPPPDGVSVPACSGFAALADGSVLVAGGGGAETPANNAVIYDAVTRWRQVGSMAAGRFYPTLTTPASQQMSGTSTWTS